MNIVDMTGQHWPEVCRIYQEGIDTGNATFEKECPSWDTWNAAHMPSCRFVAIEDNIVLGWAALSPVSSRCVYAGVAEVSVYVAANVRGKGVGKRLLEHLITASEGNGIWTLQAGIFPENRASIAIHEACGFRVVGIRKRLGKMNETWRDVCLMERRSDTVGI